MPCTKIWINGEHTFFFFDFLNYRFKTKTRLFFSVNFALQIIPKRIECAKYISHLRNNEGNFSPDIQNLLKDLIWNHKQKKKTKIENDNAEVIFFFYYFGSDNG